MRNIFARLKGDDRSTTVLFFARCFAVLFGIAFYGFCAALLVLGTLGIIAGIISL